MIPVFFILILKHWKRKRPNQYKNKEKERGITNYLQCLFYFATKRETDWITKNDEGADYRRENKEKQCHHDA